MHTEWRLMFSGESGIANKQIYRHSTCMYALAVMRTLRSDASFLVLNGSVKSHEVLWQNLKILTKISTKIKSHNGGGNSHGSLQYGNNPSWLPQPKFEKITVSALLIFKLSRHRSQASAPIEFQIWFSKFPLVREMYVYQQT